MNGPDVGRLRGGPAPPDPAGRPAGSVIEVIEHVRPPGSTEIMIYVAGLRPLCPVPVSRPVPHARMTGARMAHTRMADARVTSARVTDTRVTGARMAAVSRRL